MIAVVLSLSVATAAPTVRMALVVANNQSLDAAVRPLRYADDDAARFYDLLSAVGHEAHLLAVLDGDTAEQHPAAAAAARPPTWERLERTVRELRSRAQAVQAAGGEVEVVVIYSGHGALGARGDPYVNLLDRRLYRGDFFRDVVAGIGADFVHVIVDACRARDFVDARGGPDGPDFSRELSLFLGAERRSEHPQVGIIVAESADGETHEWSRTRSGIFGYEVLSGLSGGADVNGDGRIEYSELHAFVAAANHAIRDPRARLRVVAEPPSVNPRRPIVVLGEGSTALRVKTPAKGGWFTVEDEQGVRWVDAHLAAGTVTTLSLPPRRRYFVVDVARSLETLLDANMAEVDLAVLPFAPQASAQSRGSIAEALRSDLFRTPYGASFYSGFVVAMRYPAVGQEPPAVAVQGDLPPLVPIPETRTGALHAPAPEPAKSAWQRARQVSGVVGAGALLAGAFLGNLALQANAEANDLPQVEAQYKHKQANALARRADVLFGVGLASGITWGLTWICED